MISIARAVTEEQFQQIRELMLEYMGWDGSRVRELGLDTQEMLDFYYDTSDHASPGAFAPPNGCLLIATSYELPAGCGAFHRMTPDACELKHLYVSPEFRGMRIGRRLAEELIEAARESGYCAMRLETTPHLEGAIAFYSALGFRACRLYDEIEDSDPENTIFMEMELRESEPVLNRKRVESPRAI